MAGRRMRAPERRRQLLEVAAAEFARRGYHGTTTAQLAKAAKITEPILYRHFTNKQALFVTLVDEVGEEVIAAWRASLEQATTPAERLGVLLAGNPATHERGRGIYRVIFHAMSESRNDEEIMAALQRHIGRLTAFLTDEISHLQQQKVVRKDASASGIALHLVQVAIGFGMLEPLGIKGVSSAKDRTDVQRLLATLLKA